MKDKIKAGGFVDLSALGFSYRGLVYLATAATGFASLCAQVAWQKYLAVLVGSEARSINLAVAVFLFGLAAGCFVFGRITARKGWTRRLLLKAYGYVELATAAYMAMFPLYFEVLKPLSFNSPAVFLVDAAVSLLALILPTFLMGASIPVLTAVLPEGPKEINRFHVRIYGWNTFGAFLGALIAGFCLLPFFGLNITLIIAGILNFLAALAFVWNPLKGDVRKRASPPSCPSRIPNSVFLIFAFLAGAVAISFEILFIRLLNLSAGAGVYNFPMILSLFIGGLALGSLSIKPHKISMSFFLKQIFLAAAVLMAVFCAAPYWGIWISHIRVSLVSIPPNYYSFKASVYIFLFLAAFPAIFFMGRLLPLIYGLLKKSEKDYGASCGYLYFLNTLGTAAGTLGLGYLAFYVFDLDSLFKINLAILTAIALAAALYERRILAAGLAFLFLCGAAFLPKWDRTGHHLGYFRARAPGPGYFQKLFYLPKAYKGKNEVLYFKDGPNVSAALIGYQDDKISEKAKELFPAKKYIYSSFVVNGKAIGQTLGADFSTMFLLSGLGYLYAPEREEGLSSAVIGLGMGISAGVLGRMEQIRDVTVLEIAPEVIETVRRSLSFNFSPLKNPKVKVLPQDGFKYFSKTKKTFDLIVSQPSNPWIAGVENVFSLEFYELAKKALSENGVLIQWAQLYSIDGDTLKIMFHTLKKVFPHVRLYQIGTVDIAMAASSMPLRKDYPKARFFEPALKPYYEAMGFSAPEDLSLAQVFGESALSELAADSQLGPHTLIFPKLAYRGDKTFFTGEMTDPVNLAPDHIFHTPAMEARKIKALKKRGSLSRKEIMEPCAPEIAFLCGILSQAVQRKNLFESKKSPFAARLDSYIYLRRRGLIKRREDFLKAARKYLIENKIKNSRIISAYLGQFLGRGEYSKAREEISFFRGEGLLAEKAAAAFQKTAKILEGKGAETAN